jgi:hypothetical protein
MATIKKITGSDERLYKTSFHYGYIHNSLLQICTALGIELPKRERGDKTHYDFALEINGIFFTIYDWKESDLVNERTILDYHIGTATVEESKQIAEILRTYGLNAKCETYEEMQARVRAQVEAILNKK